MIEVEILPPEDADVIDVLLDDIHHSHTITHTSFPKAGHMHDSLYLHAPQNDKMNNIGLLASTPSSSCSYILRFDARILDICDTMVRCGISVGSVPQLTDNFESQGKYI